MERLLYVLMALGCGCDIVINPPNSAADGEVHIASCEVSRQYRDVDHGVVGRAAQLTHGLPRVRLGAEFR